MVKAGTLALASLNAVQAVVSQEDLEAFPGFAAAMLECGSGNDWRSYTVTNEAGYQLNLLRITGDNDNRPAAPRGPLLMEHGFYNDIDDWMKRTDETNECLPIELFDLGFDVWIDAVRGSKALGHDTLDPVLNSDQYWDFTWSDIGKDDLPVITDFIIEERVDDTCDKITVLAHSTAIT